MALNPNYVPLTPLWEVFTDKDELTFLADGYVKFFVDTARTVGKPVYQLTGSPPNYTYTPYGFLDTDGSWRVNMNLQGAFDQVIYGFPLDNNDEVQLYFAQFFSADGVLQFTREGFPNFFAEGGGVTTPVNINFVPNGQFLLHTDIPVTGTTVLGQVTQPITDVAFGGWSFERPMASVARDFVRFQRIGSYVTTPEKSPRYYIRITCEAPNAGDTFKDLRLKFEDVNKFSSDTEEFTFAITGKVVASGSTNVELIIIKNYGTGGDTQQEFPLTTFTLTSTDTVFSFAFTFGANTGKIIGALNDDFVQLALRLPTNLLFDVEFTDCLLTPGNILLPAFKTTTTREFMYESLFDDENIPAYDGNSIGLPLVLTKSGLRFDSSQVGLIFASGSFSLPYGFLEADGTKYDTLLHSSDGIPYSRLAAAYKLLIGSPILYSVPVFGTGYDFVTTVPDNLLNVVMRTNTGGAVSAVTDGAPATGFTFSVNHTSATYDIQGHIANGVFHIISNNAGQIDPANNNIGTITGGSLVIDINGPVARSVVTVNLTTVLAGEYFRFSSPTIPYAVWFKISGVGTAPVLPGVTLIEVDATAGISPQDVMNITASAVSGHQVTTITTTAASTIPQSSYFNFSATSQNYYAWMNINGGGTDPAIVGKIGIEVPLLSTDTKDQVSTKLMTAINERYVATPDLRGLFLKGVDGSRNLDISETLRYASNFSQTGDFIGTREYSNNISHTHDVLLFGSTLNGFAISQTSSTPIDADYFEVNDQNVSLLLFQGGSESRPENIYVKYIVKY